MKKILLLLPPLLLYLAGCTTSKKLTKTDTSVERSIDSTVTDHTRINAVTIDHSVRNITKTVREYDTDKPVDPTTGRPPLKRETTTNATEKADVKADYKSEASHDLKVKGKEKAKAKQKITVKNRSPSARAVLLIILVSLIIIVVVRFRLKIPAFFLTLGKWLVKLKP